MYVGTFDYWYFQPQLAELGSNDFFLRWRTGRNVGIGGMVFWLTNSMGMARTIWQGTYDEQHHKR
jgi:hypothetical protein